MHAQSDTEAGTEAELIFPCLSEVPSVGVSGHEYEQNHYGTLLETFFQSLRPVAVFMCRTKTKLSLSSNGCSLNPSAKVAVPQTPDLVE